MIYFGNFGRLVVTIIVFVCGLIVTFVAQSLTFQVLGTRDYGLFSVIYSVCAIASRLGVAGLDVSALRYFGTLKMDLKVHFFGMALRTAYVFASSSAIAILIIGYLALDAEFFVLVLAATAATLWAFVRLFSAMLRAEGHFNLSLLIDRPVRDGLLALACGLALLLSFKLDLVHVVLLLVCGGLIGVTTALPIFRAYRNKTTKTDSDIAKIWLQSSMGLLVVNVLQLLISRVDILWVSVIASAEMTGILNILITISDVVIIPSSALIVVFMPRIARHYELGERGQLKAVLLLYAAGSFMGGGLISILLLLYPDHAITLFGSEARGLIGAGDLEVLVLAKLAMTAFSSGAPLLMMSGNIRGMIWTFLVLIAAKLAITPALVGQFGLRGAIYVIGLGAVVLGACQMYLAWRLLLTNKYKVIFEDLQKP